MLYCIIFIILYNPVYRDYYVYKLLLLFEQLSRRFCWDWNLFIYLFIYYENRTTVHVKRLKIKLRATNLRHTQVLDNKINVCNAQR